MEKVAKIVPCYPYTANRAKRAAANSPNKFEIWESLIGKLIEGEKNSDPGVSMDLILYLRKEQNQQNITDMAMQILSKYEGNSLPRGNIFVKVMSNDCTMGFSTIKHFLEKDSKGYSHIVFQEDDIYLLDNVDGYLKEAVDLNQNIVQLATYCTRKPHEKHITGLYSLILIEPLLKNIETFPLELQRTELQASEWALKAAGSWNTVPKSLTGFKNYPRNLNNAKGFMQTYVQAGWNTGEKFLFNVGIETF